MKVTDRDIHRMIEEADPEGKAALRKRLEEKLGFSLDKPPAKVELPAPEDPPPEVPPRPKKRSFGLRVALIAVCVCVLCLGISAPFIFKKKDDGERYNTIITEYSVRTLTETAQEYSSASGKNFLCLHWYEVAEEIVTQLYYIDNEPNEMLFLQEDLFNVETEELLNYYVCPSNIHVNVLEQLAGKCDKQNKVKDVVVYWYHSDNDCIAMFTYGEYRYYLEVTTPTAESRILEIAEELLP